MKKLLTIAVLAATSIIAVSAQAQEKPLTLNEKIAADAKRDPYGESPNSRLDIIYDAGEVEIAPAAAEFMKPSIFKLDKQGNTVVR